MFEKDGFKYLRKYKNALDIDCLVFEKNKKTYTINVRSPALYQDMKPKEMLECLKSMEAQDV